ncbi:glycosyltransferase involved in cell wall biosynthesis [Ochrobactrum daejeonense]|uniref:Glycosyltransferase involved in cell wall biosynthesis n=1 Tax=Brucella daejeonensis TaxID=659015 RepID=A0A7W9B028_9HYPH|nr:glycosyltransferase [Brucella daejeonensis]MBB5703766.1 glycosyltransferase involved in cell wall biosynthesis [Brucella daejeonensis]
MTEKQIIVASTHPFMADMRLGTAYLADALCKRGWHVVYIEQPTSPLHLIHPQSRMRARQKAAGALRGFSGKMQTFEFGSGRLTLLPTIVPWPHVNKTFFKGAHMLDNWWKYAFPRPTTVLKKVGLTQPSALLTDSPYFYSLAQHLDLPTVYRYADRIQYFSEITPALIAKQRVALQSADMVLYTSKALKADLAGRTGPVHYLPNGVDVDLYVKTHREPAELAGISGPRIIYSGTLGPWLDVEALRMAATSLPDMQFILLGKSTVNLASLRALSNIHLLGTVPYYRVPEFLQHCDVGIIPFDIVTQADLVKAINPLKLYEYCAAGLPVVSYISEETKKAGDLIDYYGAPEELALSIRSALARTDENQRVRRQEWADTMSWRSRGAELEDIIRKLSKPDR